MRILRAAPPLAVLTLTAFALSCDSAPQSVAGLEGSDFLAEPARCGTEPTGPGCGGGGGNPGGGENPGSSTYDYTFSGSGDITTIPATGIGGGGAGGGDADQVILDSGLPSGSSHPEQELLVLSDDLAVAFGGADADECFPVDVGTGVRSFDFSGALRRDNRDPDVVGLDMYFIAFGTDGVTEYKYVITGDGDVTVNNDSGDRVFPPEVGEDQTVSFENGLAMDTEGKGKGSGGGNAGNACTGESATVAAEVLVEGIL